MCQAWIGYRVWLFCQNSFLCLYAVQCILLKEFEVSLPMWLPFLGYFFFFPSFDFCIKLGIFQTPLTCSWLRSDFMGCPRVPSSPVCQVAWCARYVDEITWIEMLGWIWSPHQVDFMPPKVFREALWKRVREVFNLSVGIGWEGLIHLVMDQCS